MDPFAQALSLDRRQRMNTLANKVNQAIEDAVTRAGSQVAYVDYVRLFSCLDETVSQPIVRLSNGFCPIETYSR